MVLKLGVHWFRQDLRVNHNPSIEALAKRVDKIKTLSANGSTISPKLEDQEYFLAKNPSNQSDNPATANKERAIASLP